MEKGALTQKVTLIFVVTCAVAGAVEAAIRGEQGLAVLFGLVIVSVVPAFVRRNTEYAVPIRPDLHRWLAVMSAVRGESIADIADRAIRSYRTRLGE